MLQSCSELAGEFCGPSGVDEAHVDHVAKMGAILIAVRNQLHGDKPLQANHSIVSERHGIRHIRYFGEIGGPDFFAGEDDMHRAASIAVGPVEKLVDALNMSIGKPGGFLCHSQRVSQALVDCPHGSFGK